MGQWVTVEKGESLPGIAKRFEYRDWEVIWNHHKNSQLRAERKDPEILQEGDQIYVPDKRPGRMHIQTDREHVFRVKALQAWVRMEFLDEEDQPYARRKYLLEVSGTRYEGRTSDDGMIDRIVRPDAKTGELTLWLDDSRPEKMLKWTVDIGHMAPANTPLGARQRLENLGYNCGGEKHGSSNKMNAKLYFALMEFQMDHGVNTNEDPLSENTVAALINAHRSL